MHLSTTDFDTPAKHLPGDNVLTRRGDIESGPTFRSHSGHASLGSTDPGSICSKQDVITFDNFGDGQMIDDFHMLESFGQLRLSTRLCGLSPDSHTSPDFQMLGASIQRVSDQRNTARVAL